jgi:hypothetical protein
MVIVHVKAYCPSVSTVAPETRSEAVRVDNESGSDASVWVVIFPLGSVIVTTEVETSEVVLFGAPQPPTLSVAL